MLDSTKIAIRGTTQDHLEIEDIQDNIVLLKDGSCVVVLTTGAINFGLLSEREQEATVYAYAGMLNSLSFTIQILIRSQKKDISNYIQLIEGRQSVVADKKIQDELERYKQFVKETVKKNEVLDKKFYVVIPMSALELGSARSLASNFTGKRILPFDKKYIFERAKVILGPRKDHILGQIGRMGLKGKQLTTSELIQLYYEIYNPDGGSQANISQFDVPIVKSTMSTTPGAVLADKPQVDVKPPEEKLHDQISNLVKQASPS